MTRALALALVLASCTAAAAPVAQPLEEPMLIVIAGQSNAVGGARLADATDPAEVAALGLDYDQVHLAWQLANGATDPINWQDRDYNPLAPRGVNNLIGVEVTLGRTLGSVSHLYKFAVSGSNLYADWDPTGTYPTDPPGGPNLFTQFVTAVQAQIAATGQRLGAIVWIQGNGDATAADTAAAYGENFTAFEAALRAELGDGWVFAFDRCRLEFGANAAAVRAGQADFARVTPRAVMIDSDDLGLRDADHYSADGFITLGRRFGYALVPYLSGGVIVGGTTYKQIRTQQASALAALSPSLLASVGRFREWQPIEGVRTFGDWAETSAEPFRVFWIESNTDHEGERYLDEQTESVVHTQTLFVAYPNLVTFGGERMDDIIESDATDLTKAIGLRGYGDYAELGEGAHAVVRTASSVTPGRAARILALTFRLEYDRAIS